jgi:hypothetical protein
MDTWVTISSKYLYLNYLEACDNFEVLIYKSITLDELIS